MHNLKCEKEKTCNKTGIQLDFEVLLTAILQVSDALWGCTRVYYLVGKKTSFVGCSLNRKISDNGIFLPSVLRTDADSFANQLL